MAAEAATLRLLARVRRRFAVVTDEVAFGPVRFGFTRVADPNRVLDEVAAEEDRRERTTGQRHKEPLHLPYWAELWDSGGGVATELAERYATEQSRAVSARGERSSHLALAGHTVLDLGCGQGLLGCVAASLGARVTFADLEPPALLFARLNAAALGRRAVARRVDWQRDDLGRRFDLIVGADILYDKSQWPHLERFWRAHLAPRGHVLLGEPGRPSGGMFLDWLRDKPWTVAEREQAVPTRDRPIRIFELRPTWTGAGDIC
jgi:predicted nicotinamide N-methyase